MASDRDGCVPVRLTDIVFLAIAGAAYCFEAWLGYQVIKLWRQVRATEAQWRRTQKTRWGSSPRPSRRARRRAVEH